MSKSNALRVADVRAAFRLVGDCRDAADDPASWQEVAMTGLCRLAGATATIGGEGRWVLPDRRLQPVTSYVVGYDDSARAHQAAYMREYGVDHDPIFQGIQKIRPTAIVTRRRVELVSDRTWYRSRSFN